VVGTRTKDLPGTGYAAARDPMELTGEDAGSERHVTVGEPIEIRLAETPTTGYRWEPEVDAETLEKVDDRFEGPSEPRGAAGTRVLRFEGRRPGTITLRLVKRRSWEKGAAEEFTVRLQITER
jgi:inhibitor of cysteine peptidase